MAVIDYFILPDAVRFEKALKELKARKPKPNRYKVVRSYKMGKKQIVILRALYGNKVIVGDVFLMEVDASLSDSEVNKKVIRKLKRFKAFEVIERLVLL